eukprot:gb/GECG01012302.1/.p1 GENE.gb/GECG01012302.1/~~gb/GECG01012302.1/.p1  ORF type:complete len:186 (+),score=8.74 gb/GECG01012302.1/:1-558(+)
MFISIVFGYIFKVSFFAITGFCISMVARVASCCSCGWLCTFKSFIAVGIRGGEELAEPSSGGIGRIDASAVGSMMSLRTADHTHLAGGIEALAEDVIHRYQHQKQKMSSATSPNMEEIISNSWGEELDANRICVYRHVRTGGPGGLPHDLNLHKGCFLTIRSSGAAPPPSKEETAALHAYPAGYA